MAPGETLRRSEVHDRYGGNGQRGITRASTSNNVLIFSDLAAGSQHGYVYDGWDPEEPTLFRYTGEAQKGDQQLYRRNAAIAQHRVEGRAIRLFQAAARSMVTYVGRFAIDDAVPYETLRAPATGGGPERNVLVFRLRLQSQPAISTVDDFDQAWEQLRTYFGSHTRWRSLVRDQDYELQARQ